MRPLLKLEDVAAVLNVSRRTVEKWASVHPEKLPPRTILPGAKIWRCRPEDLEKWLNEANGIPSEPVEVMVHPEVKEVKKLEFTETTPLKPVDRLEFFRKHRNRGASNVR